MKVGASTTIQVTTETPLISADSATIGTVVSNEQLTGLPLNGRGFYQLAELTPGASLQAATGNSLAIPPEIVNGNVISDVHGFTTSFLQISIASSMPPSSKTSHCTASRLCPSARKHSIFRTRPVSAHRAQPSLLRRVAPSRPRRYRRATSNSRSNIDF